MTEIVLDTNTLPEPLLRMIPSEKVMAREEDGEVRLIPVWEEIDYIAALRGSLADCPEMSVDRFLERKHAVKCLENVVQEPIDEVAGFTLVGLCGMFAGEPYWTVDEFLERKHIDKELEL
ncbi:MAG: hypothetical protein LBS19_08815 [Clostridiales bacterium]|jgi:hypothetical protein|nr:hypothetical protein [Clostridiales bacterium]